MMVLDPTRYWACAEPECGRRKVTHQSGVITPTHACRAHHGLTVPFTQVRGPRDVPARVRHVEVARDDYTNGDRGITMIEGRAVSALRTERWDGSNDCRVYAPTATGSIRDAYQ